MTTKQELIDKAIAGGITQSQIDMLLETYPVMQQESWWLHNAERDPVRAVRVRLDQIRVEEWKRQAAKWTDEELRKVAADHKRSVPVDTDKLAEAARRGIISVSSAMNSDF